jgi:phosphoribosylanthranilate isomerase
MLATIVKISNVTNLSDARYCAGMGVDMLGFSIDENSSSYITPKKFQELRAWIAGVKLVAESAETDAQALLHALTGYEVDALQVEEPSLLAFLNSELGKPLLLRINVDQYGADELDALMGRYALDVAFFLLESEKGQSLTSDWKEYLASLGKDFPILLGFGLDHENEVLEITDNSRVQGIALRGGDEIRPGYKDFGALMDILEALELDN